MIWEATPPKGRDRSSRGDLRTALEDAAERGEDLDLIAISLANYYRSDHATRDSGAYAKGVHRMVQVGRWKDWHPETRKPDDTPRDATGMPILSYC